MRTADLNRLDREIRRASRGPAGAYVEVLERAIAVCDDDPDAAAHLDVLELHSELADAYDRLGRVEDALRHADALAEHGYRSEPDSRCRRAEILTRHGRLAEATVRAASLAKLGREPDELQAAVPTLTVPGRWESPISLKTSTPIDREVSIAREPAPLMPVALAWLPADEYADWPRRWPDLSDSPLLHDEEGEPVSHVVYCRRMEGKLRAGNAPDEPDPSQLRAQYAADVARDPSRKIAWPPGRNDPCWCGSGRKYTKCCGAPGAEESPR
ncbi:MAG: SEC-C metal-binding domain-containing protein [Actinomycetota bacterium]